MRRIAINVGCRYYQHQSRSRKSGATVLHASGLLSSSYSTRAHPCPAMADVSRTVSVPYQTGQHQMYPEASLSGSGQICVLAELFRGGPRTRELDGA